MLTDRSRNLKPGGWVELQEFDGRVVSDDGSLPEDSSLGRFFDLAATALAKFGMTFHACESMQESLEKAGFVNVSKVVLKVPMGTWAKVRRRNHGIAQFAIFGPLTATAGPAPATGWPVSEDGRK